MPYRFGYQGQEKDDEIKGLGNSIDYAFRVHDPRLGRFLSIDPIAAEFPWNSPYAFSENDVIASVELEGLEKWEISGDRTVYGPYKDQEIAEFENINSNFTKSTSGDFETWNATDGTQASTGRIPSSVSDRIDPSKETATVSEYDPNIFTQWKESKGLVPEITYGMADAIHSMSPSQLILSPHEKSHLGGRGYDSYDDRMGTQINGILAVALLVLDCSMVMVEGLLYQLLEMYHQGLNLILL